MNKFEEIKMRIEAWWIERRVNSNPAVSNIELTEEASERIYNNIMQELKEKGLLK